MYQNDKKIQGLFLGIGFMAILIFYYVSGPHDTESKLKEEIITKNEEVRTVNLRVIKKMQIPAQVLKSPFGGYYLVLSNDMTVHVSRREFGEYEENQSYDFEWVETTTISSRLRVKEK